MQRRLVATNEVQRAGRNVTSLKFAIRNQKSNMSHQSDLIATDIDAYLAQHEQKELLRFLTCGSVDDGKSTLIGRLLYDSKMIYEDQARGDRKGLGDARHDRRRFRSGAVHRRPEGRARAGHHDRRGLSLLLDGQAQVHHRRHAGPRAVHAEHGDRRLDRRPGDHPDRRPPRRADADQAA